MLSAEERNLWPERMSFDDKLNSLRISRDSLLFYNELFIPIRKRFALRNARGEWDEAKTKTGKYIPLTQNLIAYHLLGKYDIAVPPAAAASYLCLGFNLTQHYDPSYQHFLNTILEWLQGPLIVLDRQNRFLDLIAHFDFRIKPEKLSRIVHFELEYRGIIRYPGPPRLFPQAATDYWRLPLRKDSVLLNQENFEPVPGGLSGALDFISEHLTRRPFGQLFPGIKS